MKVIIARPGEKALTEEITEGYDSIEHIVGGTLQFFPTPVSGTVLICDKYGKNKGKVPNRFILGILSKLFIDKGEDVDVIAGTIVIAGHEKGKLAPLTEERLAAAFEIYKNPNFLTDWNQDSRDKFIAHGTLTGDRKGTKQG